MSDLKSAITLCYIFILVYVHVYSLLGRACAGVITNFLQERAEVEACPKEGGGLTANSLDFFLLKTRIK